MSSATHLSLNDRAILGALFDPEAPLNRNTNIQELPTTDSPISEPLRKAEQAAISLLNTPEPSQQNVESAISQLTSIITSNPSYASAYTNRAQAYRLVAHSDTNPQIIADILTDLNSAISLATPASCLSPVSPHTARVLASAHTHRGYILLRASTSLHFFTLLTSIPNTFLSGISTQTQAEELASREFSIAGRYGNKTAQSLAVKTNPYAKLCGQIVREALQREIREYYEGLGVVGAEVH